MPKIKINDTKGLIQESGSGITCESKGLDIFVFSNETSIAQAAGNTDIEISIPKNSFLVDVGFIVTNELDMDGNNGNLTYSVGTSAAGSQEVVAQVITESDPASAIPTGALRGIGKPGESTNAISFVSDLAMFSSSARTLHTRLTTSQNNDDADAKVRAYAIYSIFS
tara:strand:- start:102 stop:602 length:501 start_codon:yes stop_codon:yes gene_type:complete